jgi:succinate-semialdehyde dehydrogenase / glutarate-semialdehyde dehydrogenase
MAAREFGLFLRNGWYRPASGALLAVTDKTTGEVIARVPLADAHDVDVAVAAAHEAFAGWRDTPLEVRVASVRRCAALMREHADQLGDWIVRELGRPVAAARAEITRSAELLDVFAEEALQIRGEWALGTRAGEQMLVVREPVGVVAAIAPFNYPITLLSFKLGAALLAGCTVVAKPAEDTPVATLLLAELFATVLPSGVFQVVTGTGAQAGHALVTHPKVRKVAFTGGTAAGKAIAAAAAGTVKRLTLELGGHCPAIVCADAMLDAAIPAITRHAFANSGQFCYRVNRIYAHRSIYEPLVQGLATAIRALRVGPPTQAGVDLGPLVNPRMLATAQRQCDDASARGGRILCGGERVRVPGCDTAQFFAPTLIADATPEMDVMQHETFGPVLAVQRVDSDAEALQLANDSETGLAAFVFTRDLARGLTLCQRLEAGSVWLNDIARSSQRAPFGGMKQSGLGREKSRMGIEAYLETKTVYLTYPVPDLAAPAGTQ